MVKRGLVFLLLALLFFQVVSGIARDSIDSELKKITNYAQDYETGNINYVQLLLHSSAVRESMNNLLGTSSKEFGGILKEEQMRSILGEPAEYTKWVWSENEQHETKMETEVPAWRKIIFDGNKMQIWLDAWPSLFRQEGKEEIFYRLNFNFNFKKPKEQLDINAKISEIKILAENFKSNPSSENAESLAKESVNAERTFEHFFRQSQQNCEELMASIFGTENKRAKENMLVNDITFYEGDNFEIKMKLEMCDECEWNWIWVDFWFEGRGPGFKPLKEEQEFSQSQNFKNMDFDELKNEMRRIIEDVKKYFEAGDYSAALSLKSKLNAVNEAWNQKANDVWKEADKIFEPKRQEMEKSQNQEKYWWIKLEQEKRQYEKEIRKKNYEERKQFYLDLFSGYLKKEYYFEQTQYEKRLVEEFIEFGKEICNNNQDDNNNGQVDCSDEQCGGRVCGVGKVSISKENQTFEEERELYCIMKECKAREEFIKETIAVCGNHVCENNETKENCQEDCSICPSYEALNCSGKVIFKGQDNTGCPLEPVCLEEKPCQLDEECQFLCGDGKCIEESCKLEEFGECKEAECVDGEKKIQNCKIGEQIVVEFCDSGSWVKTGFGCKIKENITEEDCNSYCHKQPRIMCVGRPEISGDYPDCNCGWVCEQEEIIDNKCVVKEDCGNEDDVCSNGICVTIPRAISIEQPEQSIEEQPQPSPEESSPEQEQPSPPEQVEETQTEQTTGQAILGFFKVVTNKIIAILPARITGFAVEGTQESEEQDNEQQEPPLEQPYKDERKEEDREQEKRQQECNDRCGRECFDRLINPCVEPCVREEKCDDTTCTDEAIEKCEESCKQEKALEPCTEECFDKCIKGEKWEKEFEEPEQPKMEKTVFNSGGSCRKAQQKTEGFVWFDGWGEPFEKIRTYKNKYYSGGQADWCKDDLESLKKQRKEFENSFNQEFVEWFFENYLANSAEDWEQHISGIFEIYWKDVDISREMAYRMNCLNMKELPEYNLIDVKYESEFGMLEFWEEVKSVKFPEFEEKIDIITPYMKIWIFPPKEFIKYEMKQAMKNHEFPGPQEDKLKKEQSEGISDEDREEMKKDEKFMEKVRDIASSYNGNANLVIQFKDFESNEIIFNLYVQINENDVIKMKPMLPEEVPKEDIKVEVDFEKVFELIEISEKDMRGVQLESPPWDRKVQLIGKIKQVYNGIKMWFKVRSIMSSAKVSPEKDKKVFIELFKSFFKGMMASSGDGEGMKQKEGEETEENKEMGERDIWETEEAMTGKMIQGLG